ncbi:unnamed protein product, partial [marine sediment metagenome]
MVIKKKLIDLKSPTRGIEEEATMMTEKPPTTALQRAAAEAKAKQEEAITTTPTPIAPPTVPPLDMPPPPTPPEIPEVPEVPPYEKSPEQIAWEEMYGGELAEWVEAGGYGIPEEIQAKMIQQTTDILRARETESLRVMRNNMERRGITNSGFVFYNGQQIRSNTSVAIAGAITDIQIKNALMKLASFEKAMGATAQFVGYLAEESLKAYQPKMAQWAMQAQYGLAEYQMAGQYGLAAYQAQVQATLVEWQAGFDLIKMEINQAYTAGNMGLASQLQS